MANLTYNPKISIVIPAYNEEKLLATNLACIQKQTYTNFEIIVVDNNSTDKTVSIAKQHKARVITEKNQGYVYALNRGLKEAMGEIIAITDADSQPDKNWLANIAQTFADKSVAGMTGFAKFDIQNKFYCAVSEKSFDLFTKAHFMINKPHTCGFNLAARKDYLAKIGDIDPAYRIGADVHLGLALRKYGRVVYVKDAVVTTSTRRWHNHAHEALSKYSKAYFYTVWLQKPAPDRLLAIR